MLAHKEVLVNIGDISKELEHFPDEFNHYSMDVKSLVGIGGYNSFQAKIPICKERQSYSLHLQTIAMDFIFEHEFSHV